MSSFFINFELTHNWFLVHLWLCLGRILRSFPSWWTRGKPPWNLLWGDPLLPLVCLALIWNTILFHSLVLLFLCLHFYFYCNEDMLILWSCTILCFLLEPLCFCHDSFISCFGFRFKHIILSFIFVIVMFVIISDHGKRSTNLKYYDGKRNIVIK